MLSTFEIFGSGLVRHTRLKIAANVVKASELVKVKLITIKIRVRGILRIFAFVRTPIWLPQKKAFP